MPIINHVSYTSSSDLENIITKENGTPLYGEIEMFRRIYKDCEESEYTWHFWHDLNLPIPVKGQQKIQIDFLLVCEIGVVIVEVKGGRIGIEQGRYYYEVSRNREFMDRSPFEQADDYMYALFNNKIISKSQMYISTICAFPHTYMEHTSNNNAADLGYKLWAKKRHEDSTFSFSDFAVEILQNDKEKSAWRRPAMSGKEVDIAIQTLLYTFRDRSSNAYSERGIDAILQRLNIDNLSSFQSLQKNDRLFIEGGPGTGKTTIAKAYVDKYHTLRGLYLCWNKLLKAKIRRDFAASGLVNCKVEQFASFLFGLISKMPSSETISMSELTQGLAREKLGAFFEQYRRSDNFIPYDYVIIDEAQDVLDKGAAQLLNSLTSIADDGIASGRYLVFFDTEQGYDSKNRQIDEIADSIAQSGARFVLDVNKRVPTNKEIISFANHLLEGASANDLFDKIVEDNYDSVKVNRFNGAKALIRHLNSIKSEIQNWNDYVVLADSNTKYEPSSGDEMFYDRIATIDGIKELNEENVCLDTGELGFTSILSYKGLESKHVILILNGRKKMNTFELYVGMTRAIVDLQILILE